MSGALPDLPDLPALDDTERACLARYVDVLREALGEGLAGIVVFGSVARGESWPRGMPIRSDLDLLVVTDEPVSPALRERLIDATLPLFLESGRQLGPQFKTAGELASPVSEREAVFLAGVRRDGVPVYVREPSTTSRRLRQ
jgi:predicted nucleotidyltransferase